MSGNRLTIFDTTLRDGEQAPGFSLRIDEKLALARQLRSAWRGHHRGRLSDCLGRRCRGGPDGRHARPGTGDCRARALPRPGHRARRLGPRARAARAAFTSSSPRRTCTSSASCACRARSASRTAMAAVRLARNHTDDVQFSAEDATRSDPDFLCQVIEAVIQSGRHDDQPARHGRLLDAGRSRRTSSARSSRACRAPTRSTFSAHCHDDLGLAVANTLAAIGARRAPGRVHDQRDRRARGQRVARRDRHGDPGARRSPAVSRPASTRSEIYRRRASC